MKSFIGIILFQIMQAITPADIAAMFKNIDDNTREHIIRQLKPEFLHAIAGINSVCKDKSLITPPLEEVFAAFEYCTWDDIKVVIIAQDPYPGAGIAHGLSFSTRKARTIPSSLKTILDLLLSQGLINSMPDHGDLTYWARQGVLLLNAALTTRVGKSNAHAEYWAPYMTAMMKKLAARTTPTIFIALGGFAHNMCTGIGDGKDAHIVLRWGHPSSVSAFNQKDCPKNFKYCTCFRQCNEQLIAWGHKPIDWNLPKKQIIMPNSSPTLCIDLPQNSSEPIIATQLQYIIRPCAADDPMLVDKDTTYAFADGGAIQNGKPGCIASWGMFITNGINIVQSSGIVQPIDIPGQLFRSSNNRGELTAVYYVLDYINKFMSDAEKIVLTSDSMYTINSITNWGPKWIREGTTAERMNMDLIQPCIELVKKIGPKLAFNHVKGHGKNEPENPYQKLMWKGNSIVDTLCTCELENANRTENVKN